MKIQPNPIALISIGLLAAGCSDVKNPTEGNDNEVITTVVLSFTPQQGGDTLDFQWADPENDGSPVIDPIVLLDSEDYDLSVSFLDELANPVDDITVEVNAESDQHQVLFTGSAVESPATGDNPDAVITQAYDDVDANGFPVGLSDTVVTDAVGTGTLTVTLRHLPLQDGSPVKTGTLAEDVAADGFGAIPGSTDTQVDFELTVQ